MMLKAAQSPRRSLKARRSTASLATSRSIMSHSFSTGSNLVSRCAPSVKISFNSSSCLRETNYQGGLRSFTSRVSPTFGPGPKKNVNLPSNFTHPIFSSSTCRPELPSLSQARPLATSTLRKQSLSTTQKIESARVKISVIPSRAGLHFSAKYSTYSQRSNEALKIKTGSKRLTCILPACNPLGRSSFELFRRKTEFLVERDFTSGRTLQQKNRDTFVWMLIIIILLLAATYAAVPLYRLFCRKTGYGGTVQDTGNIPVSSLLAKPAPEKLRPITIYFDATTSKDLQWEFTPLQKQVEVIPGNSALVFYRAKNLTNQKITGVATYNVTPDIAGQYFYKVQCFCFEEQQLQPGEEVDMPILFFLDPSLLDDRAMKNVNDIVLSYTFFHSSEDYRY